ncbi:hypothetical protein ABG067_003702 [Albugo candida]|uniref:Uncharacterized protein n=1 Tax=Albugo candida TaxID=65357 RepID=A0A024FV69_9STRA|nr:unnamed protein product [Albugo candida]|eukprot:CCI10539.1 unnamed protein product [Albugo candida]
MSEPRSNLHVRNNYNGFEAHKRRWTRIDQSASRLWKLALIQVCCAALTLGNRLWLTSILGILVGSIGFQVVRSERLPWTILYLLLCALQFARNTLTLKEIFQTHFRENVFMTHYECIQLVTYLIECVILLPCAFYLVFTAIANMANPLWRHRNHYDATSAQTLV